MLLKLAALRAEFQKHGTFHNPHSAIRNPFLLLRPARVYTLGDMARRLQKIPQPPIDRENRPSEARNLLAGALLALAGAVLIVVGFVVTHRLGAEAVPHRKLVKLITHGGVRMVETPPPAGGTGAGPTANTTIKKVEKPPQDCPT